MVPRGIVSVEDEDIFSVWGRCNLWTEIVIDRGRKGVSEGAGEIG